jgi:hypothetical protein
MLKREHILDCSSQVYFSLLSLYPNQFRARFGAEMLQIFRDCLSKEQGVHLFRFWIGTLKDLAFSLPREWRRETVTLDGQLDYTGLADAFMITVVVGTNLLGWGAAGSAFAVGMTGLVKYSQSAANVLLGVMTLPMAALIGIVCALVVARLSRVECNRITA